MTVVVVFVAHPPDPRTDSKRYRRALSPAGAAELASPESAIQAICLSIGSRHMKEHSRHRW